MVEADLERAEERAELGEKYVVSSEKKTMFRVLWNVECCFDCC